MVTIMHEQNIVCRKTYLESTMHEQTIISIVYRQLFAGCVVGLWPMKSKKKLHQIINKIKYVLSTFQHPTYKVTASYWSVLYSSPNIFESGIILFVVKVGSQLVQPMFAMIIELQRRQAELCILLRKKDQEILDYKDSGVRLSRSMVHVT